MNACGCVCIYMHVDILLCTVMHVDVSSLHVHTCVCTYMHVHACGCICMYMHGYMYLQPEENFYTCAWSYDSVTHESLLIVAGSKGIIRVIGTSNVNCRAVSPMNTLMVVVMVVCF